MKTKSVRVKSALHKDVRTPKWKMRVECKKKGKGSFKRNKKVDV